MNLSPEDFGHLEGLFEEACDLSPEQLPAFLAGRCADAPGLRAELERLLRMDQRLRERAEPELADPALPERLGDYRILRECGHGGMGTVYEAEHGDPPTRVALKLLSQTRLSPEALRRFRREARILARLRHPGIARILDAGVFQLGHGLQPYFAMEYIEGATLLEHVRGAELGLRARLLLFTRVCEAVQYAHEHGVVHRDLKPENVLVAPAAADATRPPEEPRVGQPKVLDFGVARVTDADLLATTLETEPGQLVGTLQYMSPEQARGDAQAVDARSDVYALGLLLYELLGGRRPYELSGHSIPEAARLIQERPAQRLGSVDAALRGDLETIAGKALEKQPARRYASAAELEADVRRFLDREPILARAPSAWYQARSFARRNRALVGGLLAVMLVLAAGVVASSALAVRASRNARAAEANASEARHEAYRARIAAASAILLEEPLAAERALEAAPSELRGWEWRHLKSQLERHVRSYVGPAPAAGPLDFSADGTLLVGALQDEHLAVWDARDGELLRRLPAGAAVTELELSPAGRTRVAFGTRDGRVVVCDPDGAERAELALEGGPVLALTWHPTGAYLAVAGSSGVYRWDGRGTPSPLAPAGLHPGALAFSPDGARLALLVAGQFATLVNLQVEGTRYLTSSTPLENARSLAWSADGGTLYAGMEFRVIHALDPDTLEVRARLDGHGGSVRWLECSSSGWLASAGQDGTVRLWRGGDEQRLLATGEVSRIAFHPDGEALAYAADGELRLWDLSCGAARVLEGHSSYVYQVDYSADGALLASAAYYAPEAFVWDPRTGRRVGEMAVERNAAWLGFTAGGLLHVHDSLHDPRSGERVDDPRELGAWSRLSPTDVRSPDGSLVVRGEHYMPYRLHVSDASGALRYTLEGRYWGAAFDPRTRLLAAADESGAVELRDAATGELLRTLDVNAGSGPAFCAAFHPDGSRLATGSNDGVVRLWDTETWEPVHELRGHRAYVKALAFSPDGTQLASASGDFTVRLWDTVPRAERAREAGAAR